MKKVKEVLLVGGPQRGAQHEVPATSLKVQAGKHLYRDTGRIHKGVGPFKGQEWHVFIYEESSGT